MYDPYHKIDFVSRSGRYAGSATFQSVGEDNPSITLQHAISNLIRSKFYASNLATKKFGWQIGDSKDIISVDGTDGSNILLYTSDGVGGMRGIVKLANNSVLVGIDDTKDKVGFFGTAPILRPELTGNVISKNVISLLASLGLIKDSTTLVKYFGLGVGQFQGFSGQYVSGAHLDVAWGGIPFTIGFGADENSDTRTDATIKKGRIAFPHYNIAEKWFLLL
jgi:hypothetical protein